MGGATECPPAVIVAGGGGRRIGGGKPLILLAGRPLVVHVADRLRPQVSHLAINAAADAGLGDFGLPVLPDAMPGMGPLGGILAALRWAGELGAASVLTAAVDTPFLPDDLMVRLAASGARAAFAETEAGPHATTGLWSTDLAPSLETALSAGMRKVRDWTASAGAVPVRFEDEDAFLNVNTPEDLRRAEERFAT